jgi:hypothetical protein
MVTAVSCSRSHKFSKPNALTIRLVVGQGVDGDAHSGESVKHRSRVARDPTQPNLRQVHLIHVELLEELRARGFAVSPGDLSENVTTRGIDLIGLQTGTKLHLGDDAVVEVTGLRNPCVQLDKFQKGLMAAELDRGADRALIRRAGVMSIVLVDGDVRRAMPFASNCLRNLIRRSHRSKTNARCAVPNEQYVVRPRPYGEECQVSL